jgi:membrane fusion protein, multidrug efflux system
MSLRVKVYAVLALIALLGAGAYLFKNPPKLFAASANSKSNNNPDAKKKDGDKAKEETPVELATAVRGEISSFITSTGNLRALRDVAVATQAEGIVQKVLAEEGDFVKEGQVLCVLDDAQHRIRLELATEKLEQAKLQMDKARVRQEKATAQIGHTRAELDRYDKAHKEGLVSEKEVASYRYKLDELQHDERVSSSETREFNHRVAELEAEIAQAKLEISRTQIKAPFAGYITQRMVNIGQRVRAMDGLFNLGSFSPLFADIFVSEKDARLVRPGQPAVLRLGSDDTQKITGRVERLSPIVDQATGTVKVTVELQPVAAFRPGAFVRVDIRTDSRSDAVLIPKRAVMEEDGQQYVFIANGTTVKRTKVGIGYESEGKVEVRDGITPGQKIVVAGQGALKEGAKIKVIQG